MKERNDAAVLDKLKTGDYTYIYTHPEHMIGKKTIYDSLVSRVYSSKTCLIVVDEAHCVLDWGEEYRPSFRNIKDMRPILPHAKMLALSATLTVNGQGDVAKHLLMKCFRVISYAPTKWFYKDHLLAVKCHQKKLTILCFNLFYRVLSPRDNIFL